MTSVPLDGAWLEANPLPVHGVGTTKNSRGHVVVVGGARRVPGAPRLTAEAAFRAGAGKVQVATVGVVATTLGLLLPEAGIVPLEEDETGEIAPVVDAALGRALDRCGAIVVGPGMASGESTVATARAVANAAPRVPLVLDAAAIAGDAIPPRREGALILTPNHAEMKRLLDRGEASIAADPAAAAQEAAERFDATIVLKADETFVAHKGMPLLRYPGGGVGLATSGSGDVLAGAIAGLAARGARPEVAAAWGVWLHGEAGRQLAAEQGALGFLASELAGTFPRLLSR